MSEDPANSPDEINDEGKRTFGYKKTFEEIERELEENKMTHEEAVASFNQQPKIPNHFRKFFGKKNLQDLKKLLSDPELRDLEVMVLTGDLTFTEAIRYTQVLPEYNEIALRLISIAENITSWRADKIDHSIKSDHALSYFSAFIENLELYLRFAGSYMDSIKNQSGLFKLDLIRRLSNILEAKLVALFCNRLAEDKNTHYGIAAKQFIELAKSKLPNDEADAEDDTLEQLIHPFENLEKIYEFLTICIDDLDKEFSTEPEVTDEELEELYDEFIKLSQFKKIPESEIDIGDFRIKTKEMSEDDFDIHIIRTISMAYFEISSNKDDHEDKLELLINRYSGEIIIDGEALSLSEFIDEKTYKGLKKRIYEILIKLLKGKERDLTELIPKKKIKVVKKDTSQAVAEVVQEAGKHEQPEWAYVPYTPKIEELDEAVAEDEAEEEKQIYLKQLTGISGNEVLKKLKRALNEEPVKVSGSHHFFNRRDGKGIYPISLHGKKEVGIGLLKKCLKMYGIEASEFANV